MKKIVTIILGITLTIGSAFAVGCGNDDAAKGGDAAETRTVSYVGNEKIRFDDTDKYIVKNKSSEYKIVVPADASTVVGYFRRRDERIRRKRNKGGLRDAGRKRRDRYHDRRRSVSLRRYRLRDTVFGL